MKNNVIHRAQMEQGFSLIEVLVASGLLILVLSCAIGVLIGIANCQKMISEKTNQSIALDNFLESLRAAAGYDKQLRSSLVNGTFSSNFVLLGGPDTEKIGCTFTVESEAEEISRFMCRSNSDITVTRVFVIPDAAPEPGAVLTPAPTDIIRLHVSTESPAPHL